MTMQQMDFEIHTNFASMRFLRIWYDSTHAYTLCVLQLDDIVTFKMHCTPDTIRTRTQSEAYMFWLYAFAIDFQCELSTGCAFRRLS